MEEQILKWAKKLHNAKSMEEVNLIKSTFYWTMSGNRNGTGESKRRKMWEQIVEKSKQLKGTNSDGN